MNSNDMILNATYQEREGQNEKKIERTEGHVARKKLLKKIACLEKMAKARFSSVSSLEDFILERETKIRNFDNNLRQFLRFSLFPLYEIYTVYPMLCDKENLCVHEVNTFQQVNALYDFNLLVNT